MNIRNTLKIRLLATVVLFVALLVPVSIFAQKAEKEPKKQTEQKVQKEKEPKEPKVEGSKQKEPKEPKEPKAENNKQKEPKEQQAKKQKTIDETLITEKEIPVVVMKAYKKRYASATAPVWNFYKDEQIYKVTCVYRNISTVISYTNDGVWIETLEDFPFEKLSVACIKTINAHYQDYKVNSVKKLTTGTKNDMFIIGLFESQNIKRKLETMLYLDASGAYIRSESPIVEEKTEQKDQKEQKEKAKKQKPVEETLITDKEVPVAVMKAYKKRYASADNPVWNFYKNEQIYKVTCNYRGTPTVISYKNDGTWIESLEDFTVDKLNSACAKTISTYFPDYKVNSLKKLTTNDKNDIFIVGIFESQNIKKKLETTVYLDLSGVYIRSEDPVIEEKPVAEQTEPIEKKGEKKIKKKFEKEMYIDDDAPIKLNGNELPPSVQRWVSKNYPEYIYKEVTYGEYEEFESEGRIYQIIIQRSGVNQPHATVWFTRDGNFLKLEDNFKEESQEEAVTETPKEVVTKEKAQKEVVAKEKPQKETTKETPTNDEPKGYAIEESEVKEEIMTAFKTKYPRAKNVSWEENEGVEWVVSFTDQYGQNTAVFSDKSNEWKYTKTLLPDINKIPGVIRNYIEKNFSKKQLMKGWVIKSPDAKSYYTVELYTKKGKLIEYVDFLQSGKLKE
jgi:hypothetical protein